MLASARVGVWAFIGSVAPVAIWIAVRRGLGEGAPPTSGSLLAVAWLTTLSCRLLHEACQRVSKASSNHRGDWLLHGGLTLVSLLVAYAVTFPEAPTLGVAALWSVVAAAEVAWWRRTPQSSLRASSESLTREKCEAVTFRPSDQREAESPATTESACRSPLVEQQGPDIGGEEAADEPCEEEEVREEPERNEEEGEEEEGASLLDPHVSQQWTRGMDDAGGEWIEALVRVEFAAGQRNVAAHFAFCPLLSSAPRVSATVVEGAPAEVVVAESRGFGVRLELRRAESSAAFTDASVIHVRAEAASGRELPH
ncbi:MAG: hypothetical protein U1A77_06610 [Pirellulales bacterium]